MSYVPKPMHYQLLSGAPGPDKVPYFKATRSTGHKPLDCGDRAPTRTSTRDSVGGNARRHGRGVLRGWSI